MGVLRLFRHLLNVYNNKFYMSLNTTSIKPFYVDMLLVDLNAIFHPCCRDIFTPERKDFLRPRAEQPYEEKEQLAFKKITEYIELLMKLTPPSKLLYLAIDGVAGMCKQSQQRKRRYKNAQNRNINSFDTCNISAGTPWMARLCDYLAKWITEQKKTRLANIQVIYSDMYVPGEGEHKLIRYLATHAKNKTSYCVYSPDADLIMLCMCLSTGRGYILRENIYDDVIGTHILVDCNKLKQCVTNTLVAVRPSDEANTKRIKLTNNSEHKALDTNRVIRDYVLFLMLVGNDFLPNMYCLEIGNDGIETLQDCYVDAANKIGHLVNEIGLISRDAFCELFKQLASCEVMLITKKFLKGSQFPDMLLHAHMKAGNVCDMPALRHAYYTSKFKTLTWEEHQDEDDNVITAEQAFQNNIQDICKAYVRGLNFVMTYYLQGIPTFEWCYEYHYAPLMCDLYSYVNSLLPYEWNKLQEWKYKPPLTLNQALIGVIPPSSFAVLPPSIQPLLQRNAAHPLFSEKFEIDLQGKQQEYEAICLLPNVSYDTLRQMCKDTYKPHEPLIL